MDGLGWIICFVLIGIPLIVAFGTGAGVIIFLLLAAVVGLMTTARR